MPLRLLIALIALFALTAWRDRAPEWPASGPMPDQPGHAPRFTYDPVDKGTRSYRPVDPMPWGDVNRRVAPEGALPSTKPETPPPAQPMQMKPGEPMQMKPEQPLTTPSASAAPPEAPAKAEPSPASPPPASASPPATPETSPKVDPVPRELPTDPQPHQGH